MEIKVFKDVAKRERLYAGNLTLLQIIAIIVIFGVLGFNVANEFKFHLPDTLVQTVSLILILVTIFGAMWRPYGLSPQSWLKHNIRFMMKNQKRVYVIEKVGRNKIEKQEKTKSKKTKKFFRNRK